ncbi:MAG: hypothetical protein ACRCZY_10370 [Phocaeicola sp.]
MSHSNTPSSNTPSIYVGGHRSISDTVYVPIIWTDMVEKQLPLDIPRKESFVSNLALLDGKIHAVGHSFMSFYTGRAMYWIDGEIQEVEDADELNAVTVSGADIYLSGRTKGKCSAIWKNGVLQKEIGVSSESVGKIAVSDNGTVYAIGFDSSPGVLWKNGKKEILPFSPSDIALSGGNVYIVGSLRKESSYGSIPILWKDGEVQHLPMDSEAGDVEVYVNGIAIVDGVVHIVGELSRVRASEILYWKNGKQSKLPLPSYDYEDIYLKGVTAYGNDVYILGGTQKENGHYEPYDYSIIVWKNGVIHSTVKWTSYYSEVGSIVVG